MRRISIFFFLVCALASPAFAQDIQSIVGDWIGEMNGGFKVRLHFEASKSGFMGTLINPSNSETAFDEVTADGKHLHFTINKLSLSYDGVWNAEEKAWKGTLNFQQVYSLTLKRATPEEMGTVAHKRPQEDAIKAGPLPYTQRDVVFPNSSSHIQLAGRLTIPTSPGPFPAIVLISGTGHNTRDEEVWGHKVFLILSDAFSRKGLAVLSYDKRGVGGSSGDFDAATTADFASDAEAAVTWLKTQPHIDASRTGVLGHSEGGVIAPMVAASDKSVAFVVMIAGPCIRGDKLFVLQSAMTARVYGAPDDYIAKRKVFDQRLYDAIIAAPSQAEALVRAKVIVAQGVTEKLIDANEAGTLATDDTSVWERYFIAYDPGPTLAKLKVPVLVVNGELDVQVPAKENLAAAREASKNNPNATVIEFPNMNHLLQDAKTGGPNEYSDIEETMSPVALKTLIDWLGKHAFPFGSAAVPIKN